MSTTTRPRTMKFIFVAAVTQFFIRVCDASVSEASFCFTESSNRSVDLICENNSLPALNCRSSIFQLPPTNGFNRSQVTNVNIRCTAKSVKVNFCNKFKRLRVLEISSIARIRRPTNCQYLEVLNVSNNKIPEIFDGFFNQAPNLMEIILVRNLIETIKSDTFSKLHRLKTVDLSFNSISAIDENLFVSNGQLEELRLQFNRIKTFQCKNLPNLKMLDISFNYLHEVGLDGAVKLEKLNFEGNFLTDLWNVTEDNFPKLEVLGMKKNRISCQNVNELLSNWEYQLQINDPCNQANVGECRCQYFNNTANIVLNISTILFVVVLFVILIVYAVVITRRRLKDRALKKLTSAIYQERF